MERQRGEGERWRDRGGRESDGEKDNRDETESGEWVKERERARGVNQIPI